METEKSFSGEEAEKDFCGRLFFLAAIFPFSNEKACLGVIAKTDFFYRLTHRTKFVRCVFLSNFNVYQLCMRPAVFALLSLKRFRNGLKAVCSRMPAGIAIAAMSSRTRIHLK